MDEELFFDGMVFINLHNVNFMIRSIPVVVVNDPFFKRANVSVPLLGWGRYANKTGNILTA